MIGQRVGPYEITAKLGEGGMGEVYRATDSRLKRDVAIKVLPPAFTADAERLARFEREAQLLAQLHHPNIASIFGIEESGGARALVMELVEGPTLAERMAQGPVSVPEAVAVALDIAQALEAAHEKGIVHRDLKPQNIKIAPDGTVKVLDFGLAKAMGEAAASGSDAGRSPTLMNSPTVTGVAGTQLGVILGTAGYMAPEQARGAAIDKRVDIWAFGVVFYEMLVRERLFEGESVVDTISAVMRQEIDLRRLPESTPRRLRELLRRCLDRNPKNRLHDIGDARIVLDEIARGVGDEGEIVAVAPVAAPPRRGRGVAALALVALVALLAGAAVDRYLRPAAIAAPDERWALAIPDGYSLSTDSAPQLALSDDGRLQATVVVDAATTSHLLVRSTDEIEARVLPDTEGAVSPFFSPDGRWIGFISGRALLKIPSAGGPPVELAAIQGATTTRGGTWSRDGFIYYVPGVSTGISRVSENGGTIQEMTKIDGAADERTHRWPQALPDGSAILFTNDSIGSSEYYDDAKIEALRPATGERKVLVSGASQARYASSGKLVFARGGSLFAVAFDPRALTVSGTPELAAQGVATDVSSGAVQFALSPAGSALWAPGSKTAAFKFYWVDRSGAESEVTIPQGPFNEAELSPDGKRVALIGGAGGAGDLWIADLERGAQNRLTTGELGRNPIWSPDGTHVAYVVRSIAAGSASRWRLLWRLADGSRDPEILLDGDRYISPGGFTPDGSKIYFTRNRSGEWGSRAGSDICLLSVAGGHEPELLLGGPFNKSYSALSPDGRFLAYTETEGEQPTLYVRPFPSGEGRWQISTPYGMEPRWSHDGRELFYRTAAGAVLYRVAIDTRNGFSATKPEILFDRVSNGGSVRTYAPSPDGQRIFTPRSSAGRGSLRTVYFDLGFAKRIAGTR